MSELLQYKGRGWISRLVQRVTMKPIPITAAMKPTADQTLREYVMTLAARQKAEQVLPPMPPTDKQEEPPGDLIALPKLDPAVEQTLRGAMLPTDKQERKHTPITTGCLDYFPLAIAAVAQLSRIGNEQHNPGQPLHWAREKSTDHADCIARHLIERGTIDTDGVRHSAKVAWRALAMLQLELEAAERTYAA